MKKNNNNSLLMTILGGAVFCFAFLGLAFIFTNKTTTYNGNSSLINNNEISLGDTGGIDHCTSAQRYCLTGGTLNGDFCYSNAGHLSIDECELAHGYYLSGTCYTSRTTAGWRCNTCESMYTPSSNGTSCERDASQITAPCCITETSGSKTTQTDLNACKQAFLSGANVANGACQNVEARLSCNNVTYNGQSQVIATCTNCRITGVALQATSATSVSRTDIGTYYITAEANSNATFSGGSSTLGCLANIDEPTCGEHQYFSATLNKCMCEDWYTLGSDNTTCTKDASKVTAPCCITETSGTKTTQTDLNACKQSFMNGANVTAGSCPASTGSVTLSQGNTTAYVTPDVCKTYSFTVSYSNGGIPSGSQIEWNVTGADGNTCTGSTTSCTVTVCGKGCNSNPSAKVTATVTTGGVSSTTPTTTISRERYTEWSKKEWNKEPDTSTAYIYNTTALDNPTCIGYSDPEMVNGVITYKYRYNRCCGNGSSAKCYQDDDNVYHWTSSPESSWKVVSKTQSECTNADACFEKPDGTRVWGKYYDQIVNGYKLITSIADQETCENPSDDDACYVKTDDPTDYKWSPTQPDGYTKVDEITDPEVCQPLICYINIQTNEYKMGKYENDGNYAKVYDENDKLITDITKCKAPTGDACYKNKSTGKYVWGTYGNDSNYELITTITNASSCNNEVPVPATGITVSKIIYIFMAILMACGVGFIYYSSVIKKNS